LQRYRLDEIQGQPHRMFVDDATSGSAAYRKRWRELASGRPESDRFGYVARGGRVVHLRSTYAPIVEEDP